MALEIATIYFGTLLASSINFRDQGVGGDVHAVVEEVEWAAGTGEHRNIVDIGTPLRLLSRSHGVQLDRVLAS